MNVPSPSLLPLSGNDLVDALTNGTYWLLDNSRTLTWALADYGPYRWNSIQSGPGNIEQAYAAFARFIDVKFTYTGYYDRPSAAPAELVSSLDGSWLFFSSSTTPARANFPNAQLSELLNPPSLRGQYPSAPGDIWLNLNINTSLSLSPGAGGFSIFIHEIGHTLGLKHPHDDGGTGRPTFASLGIAALDVDWFTVMSYDESYPLTSLLWHPVTPMIGDVIALQALYGPNLSTNSGSSTHVLGNNNVFQTLFDPSGTDTLDFSTSSQSWDISLGALPASPMNPYDIGLAMPIQALAVPTSLYWLYGTFENVRGSAQDDVIRASVRPENLSGGSGADTIYADGGNDLISGGLGNDSLDGGLGIDIATYSGFISQYSTQLDGTRRFLNGPDGMDTLVGIERLQFANVNVALDVGLGEAGGKTALLLGAVLGRNALMGKQALVGAVLDLFDQGFSLTDLSGAIMRLDIWGVLAGGNRSDQIATYLLKTVNGVAPDAGSVSSAAAAISSNPGGYLADLAASSANQVQINLAGLSVSGLEYV